MSEDYIIQKFKDFVVRQRIECIELEKKYPQVASGVQMTLDELEDVIQLMETDDAD